MAYSDYGAYIWKNGENITDECADISCKIIDGKLVSSIIKENLKKEISSLDEKLTLVVIQVGNNEASNIYVNKKINLCNEMGINSIYKKYDDIDEENLIKEIKKFNNDSSINGILVQLYLI